MNEHQLENGNDNQEETHSHLGDFERRLRSESPLTLTLSPWRVEGIAIECARASRKFTWHSASEVVPPSILSRVACDSPSPLNGERAGVRGGNSKGASLLRLTMVVTILMAFSQA